MKAYILDVQCNLPEELTCLEEGCPLYLGPGFLEKGYVDVGNAMEEDSWRDEYILYHLDDTSIFRVLPKLTFQQAFASLLLS